MATKATAKKKSNIVALEPEVSEIKEYVVAGTTYAITPPDRYTIQQDDYIMEMMIGISTDSAETLREGQSEDEGKKIGAGARLAKSLIKSGNHRELVALLYLPKGVEEFTHEQYEKNRAVFFSNRVPFAMVMEAINAFFTSAA